ncbi:Uncharacterised protein [Chlamydia trachomatis]|nr:Uncharacterised protein [Chlamydia trachomatis]
MGFGTGTGAGAGGTGAGAGGLGAGVAAVTLNSLVAVLRVVSPFLALSVKVALPAFFGVPVIVTFVLSVDTSAFRPSLPSPVKTPSNVASAGILELVKGSSTRSSLPTCAPVTSLVRTSSGSGAGDVVVSVGLLSVPVLGSTWYILVVTVPLAF